MQYPDKTHHLRCQAPKPLTSSNMVWRKHSRWHRHERDLPQRWKLHLLQTALRLTLLWYSHHGGGQLYSPENLALPPVNQLGTASWGRCDLPEDTWTGPFGKKQKWQVLQELPKSVQTSSPQTKESAHRSLTISQILIWIMLSEIEWYREKWKTATVGWLRPEEFLGKATSMFQICQPWWGFPDLRQINLMQYQMNTHQLCLLSEANGLVLVAVEMSFPFIPF